MHKIPQQLTPARVTMLLAAQSLLGVVLLFAFSGWVFPFTVDSLLYISTAHNIYSAQGLLMMNSWIHPVMADFIPNNVWPPGFPLLIAGLRLLGINEYLAGLVLPRIGFLLLPFLFFLVFRRMMSTTVALVAAFLSTFMFPVIQTTLMVWSDIPYLCFSLLTLAGVFRIMERKCRDNLFFILLTGMLAGYTFLIRYVGLTLALAIATGFIAGVLLRRIAVKDFLKTAAAGSLGFAIVVLPFLTRNMVVFGRLQPYWLPPLGIPLMANLEDYFQGLGQIIFAAPSFGGAVLAIMLGITVFFIAVCAKNRAILKDPAFFYTCILLAYFLFNSILLINHWTYYYTAERINSRFLIQLAWILTGGIVYLTHALLAKLLKSQLDDIKVVTGVLLLSFAVVQVFPAADFYFRQKTNWSLAHKVKSHVPWLLALPDDYAIVSNIVDMTGYFSRGNVRALENYAPQDLLYHFGQKRRFAVFLIRDDGSLFGSMRYSPFWSRPYGYKRVFSDEQVDLLVPNWL